MGFFVKRQPRSNSGDDYYLVQWEDGEMDYYCAYGKSPPTFSSPDLRKGRCENQLQGVPDKSVDLLIDDPPYGRTQAEWDVEPDWSDLAEQYHRVLADDGQIVVFGKQPSLIPAFNAFTDHGFEFRMELIWRKENNPWVSHQQPIPIHENIFVFKKAAAKVGDLTFNTDDIRREGVFVCPRCDREIKRGTYNVKREDEQKSETQGGWGDYSDSKSEDRYPISLLDRDVLEFTSVGGWSDEYTGHAGQKPLDLLSWLIVAMSTRGDTVLDPHMGSASTPMACVPLCRDAIGIEADPERFTTAEQRVGGLLDDLDGLKHAEVAPVDDWQAARREPAPATD